MHKVNRERKEKLKHASEQPAVLSTEQSTELSTEQSSYAMYGGAAIILVGVEIMRFISILNEKSLRQLQFVTMIFFA